MCIRDRWKTNYLLLCLSIKVSWRFSTDGVDNQADARFFDVINDVWKSTYRFIVCVCDRWYDILKMFITKKEIKKMSYLINNMCSFMYALMQSSTDLHQICIIAASKHPQIRSSVRTLWFGNILEFYRIICFTRFFSLISPSILCLTRSNPIHPPFT